MKLTVNTWLARLVYHKRLAVNQRWVSCRHKYSHPFHQHPWHSWWRHQKETFSALLGICAGNSPVPVITTHKGQWRGALMFSLICVWIKSWVNNREAGDLRRHHAHSDVTVMTDLRLVLPEYLILTTRRIKSILLKQHIRILWWFKMHSLLWGFINVKSTSS